MLNELNREINESCDIPGIFRHYNPSQQKGNYEFYCQEFAYSAIYGNLNFNNLDYIIKLLKLNELPQILFLVRLDDCHDIYNSFPKFSTYPQKTSVINQIQRSLESENIKSVIASFLGRDTIGVFICIEEKKDKKQIRDKCEKLANLLIDHTFEYANQSISISISDYCNYVGEFSTAYTQCQRAFINNFNKGRRTFTFFDEVEDNHKFLKKEDMDNFSYKILYYIDNLNTSGYTDSIHEMIEHISSTNTTSVDAGMYMVKLIEQISNYYISKGIEKEKLDYISIKSMKEILNSYFLSSIAQIIIEFCDEVMKSTVIIHQNTQEKMKLFMSECIKKYYHDSHFNLAKAAKLCNYSPYYFGRLFKELFHTSFNQYLTTFRIEKSKELLIKSQLSVEDIAFQLGFCSTSYFCTTFKKIVGLTPKQYSKCTDTYCNI